MAAKKFPTFYIIIGVAALVLFWVWGSYNGFISSRELLDESWAQVETQYQRRFDLIPNLVNTAKGAAEFETNTFTEITRARSQWQSASGDRPAMIAAAGQYEGALARLLATFENYPNLQATQAFRDLMVQLEGTENRISVARRDYNQSVRRFNVKVKRFPGFLLARMLGFTPEEFFEATEGSSEAPTVEFN